jgi:hypothetical protein
MTAKLPMTHAGVNNGCHARNRCCWKSVSTNVTIHMPLPPTVNQRHPFNAEII